VSRLLDNAERILEVAQAAVDEPQDLAIVIESRGGLRLLAAPDSPLVALLAQSGAAMAFRIKREAGNVRVEGRSATETCLLERRSPTRSARELLRDQPRYELLTPDRYRSGNAAKILLT
jgi:hypothetical protein